MFKRLKQTVKEKTGVAAATRYPPEVDAGIVMTAEMMKGLKNIDSAVLATTIAWKVNGNTKLEKVANACAKLAARKNEKKCGKIASVVSTLCTAISKAERKCATDINRDYLTNFSKKMIQGEMKTAVKLVDDLKKRRLEKDAGTVDGQTNPELDAAYDAQLQLVQAEIVNYPNYQIRHVTAIKQMAQTRATALAEMEAACNAARPSLA